MKTSKNTYISMRDMIIEEYYAILSERVNQSCPPGPSQADCERKRAENRKKYCAKNPDAKGCEGLSEKKFSSKGDNQKMKIKKSILEKIVKEELDVLMQESLPPDHEMWDILLKKYIKCRMKKARGVATQLHIRRAKQHVAKAKQMKDGWASICAHINKKYPGCIPQEMVEYGSRSPLKEAEHKIVCPNCGTHNHHGVDKCSNCGHPRNKGNWKKA